MLLRKRRLNERALHYAIYNIGIHVFQLTSYIQLTSSILLVTVSPVVAQCYCQNWYAGVIMIIKPNSR